jgi:hypothetical protein
MMDESMKDSLKMDYNMEWVSIKTNKAKLFKLNLTWENKLNETNFL